MKRLRLGDHRVDQTATDALQSIKLKARNRGDRSSAVVSAGYYAKKQCKPMFVYAGSSYGVGIWRVSAKSGEYLNAINNTGPVLYEVSPGLEVIEHEVLRPDFLSLDAQRNQKS